MGTPVQSAATGWRRRVGLRLLVVFALAAVVPMALFSALAYTSTRSQLAADAEGALRREAKGASMAAIERLSIAAMRLRSTAVDRLIAPAESVGRIFSDVTITDLGELDLSAKERVRLESGAPLLDLVWSGSDHALRLAILAEGHVRRAILEPDFVFAPERIGEGESLWVADDRVGPIFSVRVGEEGLLEAFHPVVPGDVAMRQGFRVWAADRPAFAVMWPIQLEQLAGHSGLRIGIARDEDLVFRPLSDFTLLFLLALLLAALASVGLASRQIRARMAPLATLVTATEQIAEGDFETEIQIDSGDEFDRLGDAISTMAKRLATSFSEMRALRVNAEALLAAESLADVAGRILPTLMETQGVVECLLLARPLADSHSKPTVIAISARSGAERSLPADDPVFAYFAAPTLERREIDVYPRALASRAWRALDRLTDQHARSILALPLTQPGHRSLAVVLMLFDREAPTHAISAAEMEMLRLRAAQAGAAVESVQRLANTRALFEGVIDLTVEAIDEKSAYTGGHCRRVPILAKMLTDAVCDDQEGAFKDISLSDEERYELHIAALLHDCGKVATPVHVMDKSTKLEGIRDGIEIVRLRAEILRRDLEGSSKSDRDDRLRALEDDLEFVDRTNVGGEFMDDEDLVRIDEIFARYRWHDRAGARHGLIDRSEAENLKIRRGTLNGDEREIINRHVVTTMSLLERLPFPPEMANVPAIAGAHHERIDGTGYPLGIRGEQLSLQGRILGLADVFEALTASDRPYKPGKPLSETMSILSAMVREGHLDADLLDLVLRKKLHLQYAREHVAAHQIDGAYQHEIESSTAPWDEPARE